MQIWRNQVLNRWVRVKARGEEEKELPFVVRPTAVTVMNIYWNYVTLTGQHKLTLLWHKKKYIGNYLAVQWFGFHASSIAEAWVCSLVRELRSWELSATQFSSVQLFSRVRLFETPWTAVCQASLSSTNSQSPPKPMSIESMMPSNHLILCRPLLLLPPIFPSIRVFSNESALLIRWPKYWSISFSISPSNEHPGLISFRMDWLDLLAVQGTVKSLQRHTSKASILRPSAFFTVQLSHPYMTTGKTIALTRWTFAGKVMSLLFNMLSRLVITFLPRSKCLLVSWLQSPSAVILEPRKIKSATVSPSISHEVMGPDAMIFVFWMLSFKPTFSLSSHFHQGAL